MLHEEDDIQKAVVTWSKYFDELKWLFHSPNGGNRNPREAGRFKAQGVKSGVADLFLPVAMNGKHGLWIELKSKKGRLSANQKEFLTDMANAGYSCVVCHSAEEAINEITEYMGLRGKKRC